MSKSKLSAIIITFNEEKLIAKCISSVRQIADEIIVVDSHSTDRTVEIAKNLGAIVIPHDFEGHIQQKNWAKDQSQYDFVLSLDADEFVSEELAHSILEEKKKDFFFSGYYVNRLNYIGNRPIKTNGWYPDSKLRLWNKNMGKWGGTNPHDKFLLKSGYPKTTLNGNLIHYSYDNLSEVWKKGKQYGLLAAPYVSKTSAFSIFVQMFSSPISRWFKSYFIRGGIISGWTGFVIAMAQSREAWVKYSRGLKIKLFGK
jgi:glycosyltransferase involved in cell wall biosynthesis